MKLTFNDRLTILYAGLLPFASNTEGIKLNRSIRQKVAFTPDEVKRLNLTEAGGGSFNYQTQEPLENFTIEVEFTEHEEKHLLDGAFRLENNNSVTEDTADTIEMLLALNKGE